MFNKLRQSNIGRILVIFIGMGLLFIFIVTWNFLILRVSSDFSGVEMQFLPGNASATSDGQALCSCSLADADASISEELPSDCCSVSAEGEDAPDQLATTPEICKPSDDGDGFCTITDKDGSNPRKCQKQCGSLKQKKQCRSCRSNKKPRYPKPRK